MSLRSLAVSPDPNHARRRLVTAESEEPISWTDPYSAGGVLISFPCLQPLPDLLMIHQVVSREPVRFPDEYYAQPSADSGLEGAPAKFAQSKPTIPVRLAEMPGDERKLFLDLSCDLIAELAG